TLAMSQGKSETFDISSSVSGDADWTLTSVVDSSGLVNVTNLTSPFFTLEALDGGVAELTYTVGSDDGQTASDRILVA
ncbi:hypothetical protein AB4298_21295, partial [Shewanella sp. 10N.261.52.F9]|uniref:hypothetical protein n=1 Tax=Shewanella sp. 10N.261.52.F9 TaxID=3229684 RepID=UPI00354E7A5F